MPSRPPLKSNLIPSHGGYRNLKTFQLSQLVYDFTITFCDQYIDRRSRTHDQMVQAARSGVQNIAEGSQASGTSKKFELKLTNVARASLEELRLDYQDYLRQHGLTEWVKDEPLRWNLVARRCSTAAEVAGWVAEVVNQGGVLDGRDGRHGKDASSASMPAISSPSSIPSMRPMKSTPPIHPEVSANAALVLIGVACSLLDRQINALAQAFERKGGFTERLYNIRRGHMKR
jgi:four helix bundle suffix protein